MSSHSRSVSVAAVAPLADRIRVVRRESRRDLAGVAVGVAIGGLLWFVLLAAAGIFG